MGWVADMIEISNAFSSLEVKTFVGSVLHHHWPALFGLVGVLQRADCGVGSNIAR